MIERTSTRLQSECVHFMPGLMLLMFID